MIGITSPFSALVFFLLLYVRSEFTFLGPIELWESTSLKLRITGCCLGYFFYSYIVKYFYLFYCARMFCLHVCQCGYQISGIGVTDNCGCWAWNLGPLEEQLVLLITEASLCAPFLCYLCLGSVHMVLRAHFVFGIPF